MSSASSRGGQASVGDATASRAAAGPALSPRMASASSRSSQASVGDDATASRTAAASQPGLSSRMPSASSRSSQASVGHDATASRTTAASQPGLSSRMPSASSRSSQASVGHDATASRTAPASQPALSSRMSSASSRSSQASGSDATAFRLASASGSALSPKMSSASSRKSHASGSHEAASHQPLASGSTLDTKGAPHASVMPEVAPKARVQALPSSPFGAPAGGGVIAAPADDGIVGLADTVLTVGEEQQEEEFDAPIAEEGSVSVDARSGAVYSGAASKSKEEGGGLPQENKKIEARVFSSTQVPSMPTSLPSNNDKYPPAPAATSSNVILPSAEVAPPTPTPSSNTTSSRVSLSSSVRKQSARIAQLEKDALRKHKEAELAATSARLALEKMMTARDARRAKKKQLGSGQTGRSGVEHASASSLASPGRFKTNSGSSVTSRKSMQSETPSLASSVDYMGQSKVNGGSSVNSRKSRQSEALSTTSSVDGSDAGSRQSSYLRSKKSEALIRSNADILSMCSTTSISDEVNRSKRTQEKRIGSDPVDIIVIPSPGVRATAHDSSARSIDDGKGSVASSGREGRQQAYSAASDSQYSHRSRASRRSSRTSTDSRSRGTFIREEEDEEESAASASQYSHSSYASRRSSRVSVGYSKGLFIREEEDEEESAASESQYSRRSYASRRSSRSKSSFIREEEDEEEEEEEEDDSCSEVEEEVGSFKDDDSTIESRATSSSDYLVNSGRAIRKQRQLQGRSRSIGGSSRQNKDRTSRRTQEADDGGSYLLSVTTSRSEMSTRIQDKNRSRERNTRQQGGGRDGERVEDDDATGNQYLSPKAQLSLGRTGRNVPPPLRVYDVEDASIDDSEATPTHSASEFDARLSNRSNEDHRRQRIRRSNSASRGGNNGDNSRSSTGMKPSLLLPTLHTPPPGADALRADPAGTRLSSPHMSGGSRRYQVGVDLQLQKQNDPPAAFPRPAVSRPQSISPRHSHHHDQKRLVLPAPFRGKPNHLLPYSPRRGGVGYSNLKTSTFSSAPSSYGGEAATRPVELMTGGSMPAMLTHRTDSDPASRVGFCQQQHPQERMPHLASRDRNSDDDFVSPAAVDSGSNSNTRRINDSTGGSLPAMLAHRTESDASSRVGFHQQQDPTHQMSYLSSRDLNSGNDFVLPVAVDSGSNSNNDNPVGSLPQFLPRGYPAPLATRLANLTLEESTARHADSQKVSPPAADADATSYCNSEAASFPTQHLNNVGRSFNNVSRGPVSLTPKSLHEQERFEFKSLYEQQRHQHQQPSGGGSSRDQTTSDYPATPVSRKCDSLLLAHYQTIQERLDQQQEAMAQQQHQQQQQQQQQNGDNVSVTTTSYLLHTNVTNNGSTGKVSHHQTIQEKMDQRQEAMIQQRQQQHQSTMASPMPQQYSGSASVPTRSYLPGAIVTSNGSTGTGTDSAPHPSSHHTPFFTRGFNGLSNDAAVTECSSQQYSNKNNNGNNQHTMTVPQQPPQTPQDHEQRSSHHTCNTPSKVRFANSYEQDLDSQQQQISSGGIQQQLSQQPLTDYHTPYQQQYSQQQKHQQNSFASSLPYEDNTESRNDHPSARQVGF